MERAPMTLRDVLYAVLFLLLLAVIWLLERGGRR
jgi:hypothetical protein